MSVKIIYLPWLCLFLTSGIGMYHWRVCTIESTTEDWSRFAQRTFNFLSLLSQSWLEAIKLDLVADFPFSFWKRKNALTDVNRLYFPYRRLFSEPTYCRLRRSRGQYGEENNQAGIFEADRGKSESYPRKISSLTTDLSFYSKSARRKRRVSV